MSALRQARHLVRLVLAWFVLSLGVGIASPLVQPAPMQLICTSAGAVKVIVQADDGSVKDLGASHLDCPLCMLTGAPPPAMSRGSISGPLPLGRAVQSIPSARIASAIAAPPPARAPPNS